VWPSVVDGGIVASSSVYALAAPAASPLAKSASAADFIALAASLTGPAAGGDALLPSSGASKLTPFLAASAGLTVSR